MNMRPLVAALLLTLSACSGKPAAAPKAQAVQLLLVGDSTMAPDSGYGDALCAAFTEAVGCTNLARGGRSSASYRAEGLWDKVLQQLRARRPGEQSYVLIQFGHNDQPGKPGRSTDLATEFPVNLQRFVHEVRAAGGTPILITPLVRRQFAGFKVKRDLQPWADATTAVARRERVALLDLHRDSAAAVEAMGPVAATELAMSPAPDAVLQAAKTGTTIEAPKNAEPDGAAKSKFDYTHLGPKGAETFARMVAGELTEAVPGLRGYLRR